MASVAGLRRSHASLALLLFLARRSLWSSRITLVLLVVSVAAGAGFQIGNSANLDGFEHALLEENLTHGAGDIRVEPTDGPRFREGIEMAARLAAVDGVRAAQPVLIYAGAIGRRGRFHATPLVGVDRSALPPFQIVEGAWTPSDPDALLIGTHYASRLELAVGDRVEVRAIFGAAGMAVDDDNVGRYTMTVRALVGGTLAYRAVFVSRTWLAAESGEPNAASAIHVHLFDHERARPLAAELAQGVPGITAIGWREDASYVSSYISATRTIVSVSYAMVIAAVAVPMWALLYIHVLRRRRELAMLLAIGFAERDVFAISLLQAIFVSIVGCVVGAGIGLGLIVYFQANPIYEWGTMAVRPMLAMGVFVGPAIVMVLTALVAGSYPAWRAARTDPARVLKGVE
ncbi:MAG: ABC transporter permease [Deltaproteobacteria bacterium]|nr:ABC transporter permease [Deltaproteobacteria bacterium]